jgi:hypothetical protein
MSILKESIGLGLILGVVHGLLQPVGAVPVVPNFSQGSMTSHTETTQNITETINSMDYRTGYEYSVTGSGINAVGELRPEQNAISQEIEGVTSRWVGLSNRPSFSQTIPGGAFQYTETYSGPGLQNQTIIQRETIVESITDTTSIFSQ